MPKKQKEYYEFCTSIICAIQNLGEKQIDCRDDIGTWHSKLPEEIIDIAHAAAKAIGYKNAFDFFNKSGKNNK